MAVKPEDLKGPCYLVHKDPQGGWRWTYFGRSGEVLAVSGESYASKWDARDGAGRAQEGELAQVSVVVPDAD